MTKMKNLAALLAVTLVAFVAASCQPKSDNQPDNATLTLSKQKIVMDNKAQASAEVTFQTNQSKVIATAPAEWLEATVKGTSILITAQANELGYERKGEVLVFAGAAMDIITVTQSSADIVLEVSPESRTVTNSGEEILVNIMSNSNAWVVEPSAYDWIQVERFGSEFLKLKVLPNKEKETREGKLFAKLGNITKQISIIQVGIGGEKFMLPLLELERQHYRIIDHEVKQGNYLVTYVPAFPKYELYDETYTFACASTVFESVTYNTDVKKGVVTLIEMISNDADELKSNAFKTFLKDNGFTIGHLKPDGGFVAENTEAGFELDVEINSDPKMTSLLKFIPVVKQPKEYPTFVKFPYDKSNVLDNPAWPTAKIIESEEAAGNIVAIYNNKTYPDFVNNILVTLKESTDRFVPHTRLYMIDTDEKKGTSTDLATQINTIWKDHTLGVWFNEDTYILTNEFQQLLKDEGFEFLTEEKGKKFFYHYAKKLVVVPFSTKYTQINDAKPAFVLSYYKYDPGTSSMHDPIVQNMIAKEIGARLDTLEALLNR